MTVNMSGNDKFNYQKLPMKKMYNVYLYTIMFYNASSQNFQDNLIVAKLDIVQAENIITFRPTVENKGGYHYPLDYLLLIKIKDENKNLSVKQQKGRFTLALSGIKFNRNIAQSASKTKNHSHTFYS